MKWDINISTLRRRLLCYICIRYFVMKIQAIKELILLRRVGRDTLLVVYNIDYREVFIFGEI